MQAYLLRRLVLLIPTVLFATFLVFALIRLLPGSLIDVYLAEAGTTNFGDERTVEKLKAQLGLDKPVQMQYWEFLTSALRGDLGRGFWTDRPVRDEIGEALPVTLELAALAIVVSVVIAIPVGVISAIRQDTLLDYALRVFAITGLSIPSFWMATLILVFPSIWWGVVPPFYFITFDEDPGQHFRQFILPALVLGYILAATVMRMTRSMMLEVMRQDYIRTAWAKGLSERVVIVRHALKNALIPVVTIMGLQFAFLMGGTVVVESIFSLPGMGTLLIESVRSRDYAVVQGINLIFVTLVILINFLVDISYAFLDPRIRFR